MTVRTLLCLALVACGGKDDADGPDAPGLDADTDTDTDADADADADADTDTDTDPPQPACDAGTPSGAVAAPVFVRNLTGQTSWFAGPAIVDLDGDGANELVAAYYSLFVFDGDGTLLAQHDGGEGRIYAPHVIADLDGDGVTEIAYRLGPRDPRRRVAGRRPAARTRLARRHHHRRAVPRGPGHGTATAPSRWSSRRPRPSRPARAARRSSPSPTTGGPSSPPAARARPGPATTPPTTPTATAWGTPASAATASTSASATSTTTPSSRSSPPTTTTTSSCSTTTGSPTTRPTSTPTAPASSRTSGSPGGSSSAGPTRRSRRTTTTCTPASGPTPTGPSGSSGPPAPPSVADLDGDGLAEVIGVPNVEENVLYETVAYAVMVLEGSHGDGSRSARRKAGWETLPRGGAPIEVDGWYPPEGVPSPVPVDLTGDGWPEIVASLNDGRMHAFGPDGTPLWSTDHTDGKAILYASEPMVVDLNQDGVPEILFGTFGDPDVTDSGRLVILDAGGAVLHDVALPNPGSNGNGSGAPAPPRVGDLDGDGQLEVVVQTFDHGMDVFTVPGSATNCLLWPTARGSTLRQGRRP